MSKSNYRITQVIFTAVIGAIMLVSTSCTLKVAKYEIVSLKEKSWRSVCIYEDGDSRPQHWSKPLKRNGLPNLFKVSEILYRGAQPKAEGFAALKELGIKTIVDLRGKSPDLELIANYKFNYVQIPMSASQPDKKKFEKFLETVDNPENQPVFVHCHHGADRTGAAVALYRIKIEKWKTEEAITEMILGCSHFHRKFAKGLSRFIRNFDKESSGTN